jgi:hypothetical protein
MPPPPRQGPPAREYPFQLDPFQQTAVNALEAGHSVLVAAHTSAGKTVVAEYCFGMALRDGHKVVYTSPLKVGCRATWGAVPGADAGTGRRGGARAAVRPLSWASCGTRLVPGELRYAPCPCEARLFGVGKALGRGQRVC